MRRRRRSPAAGLPARLRLLLLALAPVAGVAPLALVAPGSEAALIQLRGSPLAGGTAAGGVTVPLERAAGGDTPVLRFSSPRGPLRLLLDTGASATLVTPTAARRLALVSEPVGAGGFDLVGGGSGCQSEPPRRSLLPPLSLAGGGGALRLRDVEALVLPVAALPAGLDGVLGAPSLRQLPFLVDPQDGQVQLGAAALAAVAPSTARRWELRWQRGVPLLDLDGPGGRPQAALLDTGAEGLFLTPELAGRLEPRSAAQPLRLVGFCGEQPVLQQTFAGLALPGTVARPLQAIVTENPIFPQLGVELIVGQELLRERRQRWRLDRQPPTLELW